MTHMTNVPEAAPPRFLTKADGEAIFKQLVAHSEKGATTSAEIYSVWSGNVRWARNQITTAGEVLNHRIFVRQTVRGATSVTQVDINDPDIPSLVAAVQRAGQLAQSRRESALVDAVINRPLDAAPSPMLFSEATYQIDADQRATAAVDLMQSAIKGGMRSSGYIEVSGKSWAIFDTTGRHRYQQWTESQFSVTVRNPQGDGSGWAGNTSYDWSRIGGAALAERALDKCVRSQHPLRVEPGRYTVVLEPQAVADLVRWFDFSDWGNHPPVGRKVMDERLTMRSDPMDPIGGFLGWSDQYGMDRDGVDLFSGYEVAHPWTWIQNGTLVNMPHGRREVLQLTGRDHGTPFPHAFRLSGGTAGKASLNDMVGSTTRGIYITRFSDVEALGGGLVRGFTRDGVWLMEQGKITHPVKNFAFTQLVLGALNNVEEIGTPVSVFSTIEPWHRHAMPLVVPPLKIRDFSLTALADAV